MRYVTVILIVFNALAFAALAATLLYIWASPAASTLSRAL